MAQFDVYRNPNPATRARIPYLVDVQSELLAPLATRVVVPLCKPVVLKGRLAERLNPVFQIEGRKVCLLRLNWRASPPGAWARRSAICPASAMRLSRRSTCSSVESSGKPGTDPEVSPHLDVVNERLSC